MANPVAPRTTSGSARLTSSPTSFPKRSISTWLSPEVNASTSFVGVANTNDFTIWPTSHPTAAAASAAVRVPAGYRTGATATPSSLASARNLSNPLATVRS